MTAAPRNPLRARPANRCWLASIIVWAALLAGAAIGIDAGAVELRSFKSEADRERFMELSNELRCLVCQNQSLADSDADLAVDLRRQVHEMIDVGHSNREIIDYMVARYGNFVRYKPPFNAATAILWVGPFALAAGGLWFLFHLLKARRRSTDDAAVPLSAEELARLAELTAERTASAEPKG